MFATGFVHEGHTFSILSAGTAVDVVMALRKDKESVHTALILRSPAPEVAQFQTPNGAFKYCMMDRARDLFRIIYADSKDWLQKQICRVLGEPKKCNVLTLYLGTSMSLVSDVMPVVNAIGSRLCGEWRRKNKLPGVCNEDL